MSNKEIAGFFKLLSKLIDLHGENKFKARSYNNVAFQLERFQKPVADLDESSIAAIKGVGPNMAPKIMELLQTGEMVYLQEYLDKTPEGVIDILTIKGLGPSKVRTIWKDLEVETIGELLYACRENRLVDLKGFGQKTQQAVIESIEFKLKNQSKKLYAGVESFVESLLSELRSQLPNERVEVTGAYRRRMPVVEKIEFIASGQDPFSMPEDLPIAVDVHRTSSQNFESQWFKTTATEAHLEGLAAIPEAGSEVEIYQVNGLGYIAPEMREGLTEFEWIKAHDSEELISHEQLTGSLHNHSTWSDGQNTLLEMAQALVSQGMSYLGICDHSKSAFYANGLNEQRIVEQHAEIDTLNQGFDNFVIFKGIESDILVDGSLDYDNEVLASFDFVVASIHSVLKMDEAKATQRLIRAIENPYTTILGHPTGRLLLSRPGYPIDHKRVIDACAANGVVLELNANPMRLDIDWRWIGYAMQKHVMVSINPDAHRVEGYDHMRFGVLAARKGGLVTDMTFNAQSRNFIADYFKNKKP